MVTSVVSVPPLIAPHVEAGTLSVSLNVSLHSVMLSLTIFIANDFDISPAGALTAVKFIL